MWYVLCLFEEQKSQVHLVDWKVQFKSLIYCSWKLHVRETRASYFCVCVLDHLMRKVFQPRWLNPSENSVKLLGDKICLLKLVLTVQKFMRNPAAKTWGDLNERINDMVHILSLSWSIMCCSALCELCGNVPCFVFLWCIAVYHWGISPQSPLLFLMARLPQCEFRTHHSFPVCGSLNVISLHVGMDTSHVSINSFIFACFVIDAET